MKTRLRTIGLAVLIGFLGAICGARESTDGSLWTELDQYGGWTKIKGEKTGFFHLDKIDGRDWFITPAGNVFYPVALSHPFTGESTYVCRDQFGGDFKAYAEFGFEKLLDLGFNCSLAAHTSPERNRNGFVQAEPILDLFEENNFPYTVGIYLLKHPLEFEPGEGYPDIFSESYMETWAANIKETCLKYKDNPLVMGYYYGFGGLNDEVGFINALLQMPPSSPGRQTMLEHFVGKYGNDLDLYNSVYGKDARSAQDIIDSESPKYQYSVNRRHLPQHRRNLNPNLVEDFEALIMKLAVHFYKFGHTEIRKWDTNHLIFGSYLKPQSLNAETWKAVSPYVDTISPQHVQGVPDIDEFIRVSGRPVLVSDQLFGIVYPDKIRFSPVESHAWRGRIYSQIMKTVTSHPGMLGVSYCNCLHDQVDPSSRLAVGEQGFFDQMGVERLMVSGPVRETNEGVYLMTQSDQGEYGNNVIELDEMWKTASEGVSKDPADQWRPTK